MSIWRRIFGGSKSDQPINQSIKKQSSTPEISKSIKPPPEQVAVEIPTPGPPGNKYWASPTDLTIRPAGSFRLAKEAKAYLQGIGGTVQNTETCQITKYNPSGKCIERSG